MDLYSLLLEKILDEIEKTPWYKFGRLWYLKSQLEIYTKLINQITKERKEKENTPP